MNKETARKLKLSKKAVGSMIVFFVMVFLWFIIALAVAAGIYMFFSAFGDVRGVEAEILNEKINECVIKDGYLIENFNESFDVFSECKLDKGVLDSGFYFFKIGVYENDKLIFPEIKGGDLGFDVQCKLKGELLPNCYNEEIFALKKENDAIKKVNLKILTASNNFGREI